MAFIDFLNRRAAELNVTANELDALAARLPSFTTQQNLAMLRIVVELTTPEKPPAPAGGPNLDVFFSARANERRRKATVMATNAASLPPFTPEQEAIFVELIAKLQRKELL